jgi:hypothetical protein
LHFSLNSVRNYLAFKLIRNFNKRVIKSPELYFYDTPALPPAGHLYPVEIKSGQTLSGDMFDSLLWWCKLSGRTANTATLVYGGEESYTRRGVAVRPWFGV